MSRNASGVCSLVAGNPPVADTVISVDWADDTLTDIADEITNSLDRNGRGGMLAALKAYAGTKSLPGISFSDETSSGFYRDSAGDIRFSLLGADLLKIDADGIAFWDGSAWQKFLFNTITDDVVLDGTFEAVELIQDGTTLEDVNTRVNVRYNGTSIGTRRGINLIAGSGCTLTVADNNGDERVDVTIANAALLDTYAFTAQAISFTATANSRNSITGNGVVATLPVAPADNDFVQIANGATVTGCSVARNGKTIMGLSEDMSISTPNFSFTLVYRSATGDWRIT